MASLPDAVPDEVQAALSGMMEQLAAISAAPTEAEREQQYDVLAGMLAAATEASTSTPPPSMLATATEAAATEAVATETTAITHDPPTREDEAEAKVAKRDARQSPAGVTHAAALEEVDTAEALPLASSPALREAEELEQAQAESAAEALSPQPTAVAEEQACVRKSLTPMRDIEGVGSFLYTVLEQFVSPSKGVEKRSRCGCI